MANPSEKYVLLTGCDLGNRELTLSEAAKLVHEKIGRIISRSKMMETEPWGFESDTRFLNQALMVETHLNPEQILAEILLIEESLGRVRNSTQWSSRTIDIDILCSETSQYESRTLTIPHKFLHERAFALSPLCQIAPNWKHPILGINYFEIAASIDSKRINTVTD